MQKWKHDDNVIQHAAKSRGHHKLPVIRDISIIREDVMNTVQDDGENVVSQHAAV